MGDIDRQSSSSDMQAYYDGKAKHPGGRPTIYNPAIIRNSKHYLANYAEYGDKIPSIAGLAVVLKTCRERLHIWANDEDKQEFRNIINQLRTSQEHKLLNNGLDGTFNSNITKLILGKHGYYEKQEVSAHIQISKVERNIIDVVPELIKHDSND